MDLYFFFHLNLAFSSIEEEQRPAVVKRCYWPILRLAERLQIPMGVEATGYTLRAIAEIDPEWIRVFRGLVHEGPCELIGSGLTQMIGPLVPSRVTAENLRLGSQVYEELIGLRPRIALLGEQAFSAGLVPIYKSAGFEAVITEWNNAAQANPEWSGQWKYYPQLAAGTRGEIPVVWNESIAFQKFQRYVQGEADLDEYRAYLSERASDNEEGTGCFPLYGSDAEIFDFRPGRFPAEAKLGRQGEWQRIEHLFTTLREDGWSFISPSDVLAKLGQVNAGHRVTLGSSAQPVLVKKQGKYNLLRWAVTGRDDLGINTRCWKIYEALLEDESATGRDWAELCYLWSSDFRTHITDSRWEAFLERLARAERRMVPEKSLAKEPLRDRRRREIRRPAIGALQDQDAKNTVIKRDGRFLVIEGKRLRLRFNCRRGLALDRFVDLKSGPDSLTGTLPHGYFEEIDLGADFYTGHLVFESPGRHKTTDLEEAEPIVQDRNGVVTVSAEIQTELGPVMKTWTICDEPGRLGLEIEAVLRTPARGSLRLGHVTLMPEVFDQSTLFYRTHNGGEEMETFRLDGVDIDHLLPVSALVSARHAVGLTGGLVDLGDARRYIRIEVDKTASALVGMVSYKLARSRYLYRLVFSAQELDDTSKESEPSEIRARFWFSIKNTG